MILRVSAVLAAYAVRSQVSVRLLPFKRPELRRHSQLPSQQHARMMTVPISEVSVAFSEEEDEEEEEETELLLERRVLDSLKFKNFEVSQLRAMEEDGRLALRPFYQRGYKWTQKQASLWIESMLRGFPCLPELTLLQTEDSNGETQYATFDGQQRLTSIMKFITNERGDHWPQTKTQKRKKTDTSFALEALPMMKHLEDKTFKDFTKREQNAIKNYDVRCAIIPSSWAMEDYIEFFKRIQGGGTPMSDHELRRAISRGPFTELLDELAQLKEVNQAFAGCKLAPDQMQQLLLRYFALKSGDVAKFGKPSMAQEGLETMKRLNKEMGNWHAKDSLTKTDELVSPLKDSLDLATFLFNDNERFRRVAPLIKNKEAQNPAKVWMDSTKLNPAVFVCVVYCFSVDSIRRRHMDIRQNREDFRSAIIDLMQTDPAFTDSLKVAYTSVRLTKMEATLHTCLENTNSRVSAQISCQVRRDLIANARKSNNECPLCKQALGPFDEHLHIDHIVPRAKGGNNEVKNLQVVHKTCNLRKSDKMLSAPNT